MKLNVIKYVGKVYEHLRSEIKALEEKVSNLNLLYIK